MKRKLAFVLSGGGSLGALQVGAIRALFEADIYPDMLVGTSIGAINSAFLAMKGVNREGLELLVQAWKDATEEDIMSPRSLWLNVRSMFDHSDGSILTRFKRFFEAHGFSTTMNFKEIRDVELYTVATDLKNERPVIFGVDPNHNILDGVIASAALPPWIRPIDSNNMTLIDGAFVSNLPIEAAINLGAAEIIALHLIDPFRAIGDLRGFQPFVMKIIETIEHRQAQLELALARARQIPVHYIRLETFEPVPLWVFRHTNELIESGYRIARLEIKNIRAKRRAWWQSWIPGYNKIASS
jgi:NTE family protein